MAAGYDNEQIAEYQKLPVPVLKNAISHIYGLLGLKSFKKERRNPRVMLAWWWRNVGKNLPDYQRTTGGLP